MKFKKHSAVIAMFGKEFVKTGLLPEELHQHLIYAYSEREKSDYEPLFMQSENQAQNILKKAEAFIYEVEKFLLDKGYNIKKEEQNG
jgi:uncharacterized protein (UPF0332 family)